MGTAEPKRSSRKPPSSGELMLVGERLDAAALGAPGVRDILREVLTALDVTALQLKVRTLITLGILAGLVGAVPLLWSLPAWVAWLQVGVVLVLLCHGAMALSQMVYIELSRHRPARWSETRRGLLGGTFRLSVALLLILGLGVALVAGLAWLATWLLQQDQEIASFVAAGLAVVLAVKLLVFGPAALLLAPILTVEECGIVRAVGQWLQLLRENLVRTLLYNLLATGLALLLLAVPAGLVALLAWLPLDPRHAPLVGVVQALLAGVLAAGALGFLTVVQVFLYLNLRFVVPR